MDLAPLFAVDAHHINHLMITSTRNPKVQHVRALLARSKARRETQTFVVEGVRLIEESQRAEVRPILIFFTKELSTRGERLRAELTNSDVEMHEVSPDVMLAASDTQSPQGLLAVLPILELPVPDNDDFVLILDNVRDPGNAGTMLRTAAAAGVTSVILTPGCVDVYAPKVVRAAMGAHFHLSIRIRAWEVLEDELDSARDQKGTQVYLADAHEGDVYTQIDYRGPTAIIVGGEAQGAGEEALELMNARIRIPMLRHTESLNTGIATGVLLFEVLRQRSSDQI